MACAIGALGPCMLPVATDRATAALALGLLLSALFGENVDTLYECANARLLCTLAVPFVGSLFWARCM